jgi:hypothetical protein
MTIVFCAAGLGVFGLLAKYWSPAMALAAVLILAVVLRAVTQ